jgi:very-short-patch-repair endonuclease
MRSMVVGYPRLCSSLPVIPLHHSLRERSPSPFRRGSRDVLQGPRSTILRSRRLRKEMSLPERLLWRELRKRPGGLKWRKQHPAGSYTADFYCHDARLVVEVDGEAHDRGNRPVRDARKNAWFAERKFQVLHVPAAEVLRDLEGVLAGIVAQAESGIPLHRPAAGPPPLAGEDF